MAQQTVDNDPRRVLVTRVYGNLRDVNNDSSIDKEAYIKAHEYVERELDSKQSSYRAQLTEAVASANKASQDSNGGGIVAASIGVGLVANAITDFSGRSAALVCIGILLLILSILFGWLDLQQDNKFYTRWAEHWRSAIALLYSWQWKDIDDLNRQVTANEDEKKLALSTSKLFSRLQIVCLFGGFILLFSAILDLQNVPSYLISQLF